MKKILTFLLAVMMVLSFAACKSDEDKDGGKVKTDEKSVDKFSDEYASFCDEFVDVLESGDKDKIEQYLETFYNYQKEIANINNQFVSDGDDAGAEAFMEEMDAIERAVQESLEENYF